MTTMKLKTFSRNSLLVSDWVFDQMGTLRYVIETSEKSNSQDKAIDCYNWVCDHLAEKSGRFNDSLMRESIIKGLCLLGVTGVARF